jgi:hypothetical protein
MATIQQLPGHPAAGDQVPLVTPHTHPAPLMGPARPGTTTPLTGPATPGAAAPLMGPADPGTAIPLAGLADVGNIPLMGLHPGQRSFCYRKETS